MMMAMAMATKETMRGKEREQVNGYFQVRFVLLRGYQQLLLIDGQRIGCQIKHSSNQNKCQISNNNQQKQKQNQKQ